MKTPNRLNDNRTWTCRLFALAAGAALLAGCASHNLPKTQIGKQPFGATPDGEAVDLYTLRNDKGAEVRIMTYGGIIVSLDVPDVYGHLDDVVLGYNKLDDYVKNNPYFGSLIGRYGNRIAGGKFVLDGVTYTLATNNGPNALHGGLKGFDKRVWSAVPHNSAEGPQLVLTYLSKDGEEGYPGDLAVTAIYTLMQHENALRLEYTATTGQDTILNLTQHSYFNLAGTGDILRHLVRIPADHYTPVDATLIPTGELAPVKGTPFDFRTATAIGKRINADNEQLKFGGGYDHNWCINKKPGKLGLMARVTDPESGRVMEFLSTEPGLQFYTGNFLDGTIMGKGSWVYQKRAAFCMEPQHYPDSPNKPQFPSAELKAGQVYRSTFIYRFSAGLPSE